MINKELFQLKDEFLKDLRELEEKLDKKIERHSAVIEIRNQDQEDKLNLTIQKNSQLFEEIMEQKIKIEKISELNISQKKLNDMLISHELRINKLITENKRLTINYDKIITDNLIVPGYIGTSCLYRNLSEYLQSNINDIQKIKNEKENEKKITEDIRSKLDNFIKNMVALVDNTVTRCKEYTDNKQVYLENILNNKLVEFNEKNMDLRTQLFANLSKTNKEFEKFSEKINEFGDLKIEINNEINTKINELKNAIEENKNNTNKNIEEFKNSINEITEKFDNLNKNQNNSISNLKKNEEFSTQNLKAKIYKKREELLNNSKIKKRSNKRGSLFRNRTQKTYTIKNSKIEDKKYNLDSKVIEKEENKTVIEFEKSDDESSNKIDEENIIINGNLFNEEKKEEDIKKENEEIKNNKIDEIKENYINNENQLNQVENKSNINQNKLSDKKKINLDLKNITNYNKDVLEKRLNSYYVNSIKTTVNKLVKKPEDNNYETILAKENKISIPKIIYNLKKNEKDKSDNVFNTNKNMMKKNNITKTTYNRKIETRNNISKSTSNSYNHIHISKEKEKVKEKEKDKDKDKDKERDLKSINSDRSIFGNINLYNTSSKFYNSIETQTKKIFFKNKTRYQFPKIGFSYKIINLGSDIDFKERNLEAIQKIKENSKMNIDLSIPLTNTYKSYQKKKNEKKIKKFTLNELPSKDGIIKHNFNLPIFNNIILNNNSFYKKKYQSIDYEYTNLKKNKYSEGDHSIESVKSTKIKIIADKHLK